MEKKLSNFSQFLLWFGAAVSIAEILTGALIAPLGLKRGIIAIFIGHIIGGIIFYAAGFIGAKSKLSAIESTRISFGKYGSYLFSILNIMQLLGWTAVMIINGAKAFDVGTKYIMNFQNEILWCILIAILIAIWIIVGVSNLSKINIVAVGALFVFTMILGITVFGTGSGEYMATDMMTFGAAVELSAIMPLSWLPLISDYTRNLKNEKSGTLVSALGYFIGSTFMYIIGLGASLFAGTSDITEILLLAGLGFVALIIVLFSTVTTTFLDVYSAGVSFVNINNKVSEKIAALVVCFLGMLMAIFIPITQYENFLYLIGSVFAPLFAILITDYFILNNKSVNENNNINIKNTVIWLIGIIGYRKFMPYNSPLGITLPIMLGISIICILINGGMKLCLKKS